MFYYSNEQLSTLIILPIIIIVLIWTLIIFSKNNRFWQPYDLLLIILLILNILRNLIIIIYIILIILIKQFIINSNNFQINYCNYFNFLFNSIHIYQAFILTTLSICGLFIIKFYKQKQQFKQFLTVTHIVYHLFCLTILCGCVGIAALLAQNPSSNNNNNNNNSNEICKFMPYDLDIKFNFFIIILNIFLTIISFISFFIICYQYYYKQQHTTNNFDYLKKSNSDLSQLSLSNNNNNNNNNSANNEASDQIANSNNNNNSNNGGEIVWNSDMSNISTTVSSTNSRRPCLNHPHHHHHHHHQKDPTNIGDVDEDDDQQQNTIGLETIHPILIVSYLFYHLPIIILCIYPNLIHPWPVPDVALWLGLIQDLLIPISLSIVDTRFCRWIGNVYKCNQRQHDDDKLPQIGLDGKFRPFCPSQPQSLEIQPNHQQVRTNHNGNSQSTEHRFPITNGSLYTSIDGHLPVIHNYRRHKDQKGALKPIDLKSYQILHQQQQQQQQPNFYDTNETYTVCHSCQADLCPSHSNLHHLTPHYINKQLNLLEQQQQQQRAIIASQESLPYQHYHHQQQQQQPQQIVEDLRMQNTRILPRLNRTRLCKSADSLNDLNRIKQPAIDYFSSDDNDNDMIDDTRTISSQSSFSITTDANCDFDFYQNSIGYNNGNNGEKEATPTPDYSISTAHNGNASNNNNNNEQQLQRNDLHRLSFENLQLVPDNNNNNNNNSKLQRSNSFLTTDERRRKRNHKKSLRSNSKLSDCTHNIRHKIKSVEYLPTQNVLIEDIFYFNYPKQQDNYYDNSNNNDLIRNYVGSSVPDLKKVFISEYI